MSGVFTYNPTDAFEQLYIRLREKEGRLYTDEELVKLPAIRSDHFYQQEWAIRERSLKKMATYLKHKGDELAILEVGCGNGWLTAQLATLTKNKVTGIDVNGVELDQAKRVFHHVPNLEFIHCTLDAVEMQDKIFDVIIFAAAIQYFPSLKKIIKAATGYLTLQGEIYIMDSVFYRQDEIAAARKRSADHFSSMGCDEMAAYYFHHSMEDLKRINPTVLHDPSFLLNRFSLHKNPFYHVVIKNRYQ
jgi:2-polyprenyl-3-methyl-5-hydroxy-6-metoxy-1,4-benzoquinol methylase